MSANSLIYGYPQIIQKLIPAVGNLHDYIIEFRRRINNNHKNITLCMNARL
nr:MAG TPA: hypothetical protein [Caudoviricetes sp.]